jgi:hypothetical protein
MFNVYYIPLLTELDLICRSITINISLLTELIPSCSKKRGLSTKSHATTRSKCSGYWCRFV